VDIAGLVDWIIYLSGSYASGPVDNTGKIKKLQSALVEQQHDLY